MTGLVYLKVAVGVGMVLYQKLHEKSKSTGRPIGRNWHWIHGKLGRLCTYNI